MKITFCPGMPSQIEFCLRLIRGMTFSGVKQIALIFLTMVAPLAAASDSSFLGVKAWQGSVSLSSSDSGQVTSMFGQEVWSTSYQADLKITLDQFDADGQLWQGPVTGSVHIQHKMVQTMPDGCVVTTTATADGPPDTSKIKSSVLQVANGQYWFGSLPTNVKGRRKSQMVCPDSGTVLYDDISGEQWWPVTDPTVQSWFALPESGLSLQGAADVKLSFPLTVYGYSMTGAQNPKLAARLTWQFQPSSVSQDEVTVSIPGYDTWRPQAGADGGRGNSITLNAELRTTEGGAPAAKAVRFEWSFPNISHELGYAINAPIVSADQKPDMRFEPSATLTIDDELGQKAHTPDGIYTTSMAQISSYDWGGYGTVQVVAVLEDGRRITGHLEGSTSQTEILLPKRAAGDTIAEAWRKQMGIGTLGDTTDDDNFPVGDGNKGDGLTLYEEYRGWMENGKHKEGDPTKKDFFVVNTAGSGYTPGILLYGSKSQLSIHYELLRSELSGDRVINFNHTQAPHRIDQHGVVIVSVSDGSSPEAHSDTDHPDTPAHIKSITVPKMTGSTTAVQQQSLAATLAHGSSPALQQRLPPWR